MSEGMITEAPPAYMDGLEGLRRRFGIRVLGGCCGTAGKHITPNVSAIVSLPQFVRPSVR